MPKNFYNSYKNEIESFIDLALAEDIGVGDHSSLSCIDSSKKNTAQLIIKDKGHIAGINLAKLIFKRYDSNLDFSSFLVELLCKILQACLLSLI